MKISDIVILTALAASLVTGHLRAQTFATLHTFTGSDGDTPVAGLTSLNNVLFGTTRSGGPSSAGTVFAINNDGSGFATVKGFTGGRDGAAPNAGLISSGNTLYGTSLSGGSSHNGTVFAVNTDGSGFRTLHSFSATSGTALTNSDGCYPQAGLVLSNDTLYGTTRAGGLSGNGTVFAVNTDGTGFTTLHSFAAGSGSFPDIINTDGAYLQGVSP